MFVITKNNLADSTIEIIDVVDEEDQFIEAFEIMTNDCLKYVEEGFSIKIINKHRIELKKLGIFTSPVTYIYELHPFKEPELSIIKEVD